MGFISGGFSASSGGGSTGKTPSLTPLSSLLNSESTSTAATSKAVKVLNDKLSYTQIDLTSRGFNILDFINTGEMTHANAFQRANDFIRQKVLSSNLGEIPSLRVPSGTYVIDKTVIMSPYLKIKSEGIVRFNVTVNGIAFHITPSSDDPRFPTQSSTNTYNYAFNKNAWNRGKYFDGSNGGFIFTTQLNRSTSNTAAIAIGKSDFTLKDDMRPTSRYSLEQVNIFGFNKAFLLYAIDNYLGNFKNCHLEGNYHHAHWVLPTGVTGYHNSGENQVWESCIFAQSESKSFLIDSEGSDFTFENCSFDFNQAPLFEVNTAGTKIRVNDGHIEGTRADEGGSTTILTVNNPLTFPESALLNERNQFSLKDTIVMNSTGSVLFKNNPNKDSGARINLYLNIDGLDNRITSSYRTDFHSTENFFITRKNDNIRFFKKAIYNMSAQKALSSPDINIISNGDFSLSKNGTVLTNSGADTYWDVYSSYGVSNITVNDNEGLESSKCLKFTITNKESNYITLINNFHIPVTAGEVLYGGVFVKLDNVSIGSQCNMTFKYYDANGSLIKSYIRYDFLAHSSNLAIDPNKYRMIRGGFVSDVPSGAISVVINTSLSSLSATDVSIDSIYLEKGNY